MKLIQTNRYIVTPHVLSYQKKSIKVNQYHALSFKMLQMPEILASHSQMYGMSIVWEMQTPTTFMKRLNVWTVMEITQYVHKHGGKQKDNISEIEKKSVPFYEVWSIVEAQTRNVIYLSVL